MPMQRVELLSTKSTVERVEQFGLNEAIAKLNIFRTLLHRPKTAKAIYICRIVFIIFQEESFNIFQVFTCYESLQHGPTLIWDW